MQPFHDINELPQNEIDQYETPQSNVDILNGFLSFLGEVQESDRFNDLYFNDLYNKYIDELEPRQLLKEQAEALRTNYPGLFEKLSVDFSGNSIKSANAEKYLQDYIKLEEHFKGKSLVDAEIEALKLYLPILIEKKTNSQEIPEPDQHGEPANTDHDAGEFSQLERFDHALFRIVVNQSSTLEYKENSAEHYYQDVQSILINALTEASASDFEKIIAQIPTRENFNMDTIWGVLIEYSQQLYNNINAILSNQEIGRLVQAGGISWVYIVEQLMGVYYDLFAAYIREKHPQLLFPDKNGILPSFSIIINFFRTITDKLQSFVSNEQNLEKIFDEIKERIDLIKRFPDTPEEISLQARQYNTLVELQADNGQNFRNIYDIDEKISVLNMISSPIPMVIPNIKEPSSAQKIFEAVIQSNDAFFRGFPSHNFSEIDLIAIHRLFKTFFNHQDVPGNIKNKQSDVENLLEKVDVKNIEAVIFSAKLRRILSLGSDKATDSDKIFSDAVTAVAIIWRYPTLLNEVGVVTLAQIQEFNRIQSGDPTECLSQAVQWAQTWSSNSLEETRSLPSIINDYYKTHIDSLHRYPGTYSESRISSLKLLIPVFFIHANGDRSRAFNKGIVDLDELVAPPAVLTLFDSVLDEIAAAEDKEKAIAEFIQKVLQECISDTKSIFPSFENITSVKGYSGGQVLHQIFGAQISYLKTKYVKGKGDDGRIIDAIVEMLQHTAEKIISNSTSYESVDAAIRQLNTTSPNYEQFGLNNRFSYKIASKIPGLKDVPTEKQCFLFLSYCGGMSKQDLDSLLRDTYELGFDKIAQSLRDAARDRNIDELDGVIQELTNAAAAAGPAASVDDKSYEEKLQEVLDNNTELPLYFDEKRITEYLKEKIEQYITENAYGETSDKERILTLLNSKLPLSVKLKLIGSIALGNTEYPPPVVDIGRVHSRQAQAFYKRLSCFADVGVNKVSETFTEFLKSNGEKDAANVTNIEHYHQRMALTKLEKDRYGTVALDLQALAGAIEKRLILSIKSGAPIITDRLVENDVSQDILNSIKGSEQAFIDFIYNIFTTTKLNQLFAELVTAEKQIEFVTAVTSTLLSNRECGSDERQRILAAVRGRYIPVILNSVTESCHYLDPYLFDFHEKITKNLESCVNVEAELWNVLKSLLSEYNPENKREDKSFITNILDNLEVFHNYLCRSNPAFDRQLSAVIIEKAVYFLKQLTNQDISSLKDLDCELEKIDFTIASPSRKQAFGLTSISGGRHTLTSLLLERMKQPEVARHKDTLDAVLALNSKPEPVVDENDEVIDEKGISKTVKGKVDESLRIKAIASILFSLGETDFNSTHVSELLRDSRGTLTNLDDLCEVVKEVITQAERLSQYTALEHVLPTIMQTLRSSKFSLVDMNQVTSVLISCYEEDDCSTKLEGLLVTSIAAAAGKSKRERYEIIESDAPHVALSFIAARAKELVLSRQYSELLTLANVLPKNEIQQLPGEAKKSVKFNDEDQSLEDDGKNADIYQEDDVHLKKFKKVNEPWKNSDRVFVLNDLYIQEFLIKKLKAHLDGIKWPIEREAKEAMLKTLQSNLPLLSKLNVIGNIAQGLFNDATFGNTHGIRRRKEDHKLYGYLSGFADITERQKILPQFTTFLKSSAPEQVPDSIDNVDHYVQHYAVIQTTLELIDEKHFSGHALTNFQGLKERIKLSENYGPEIFREIFYMEQFLKNYRQEIHAAAKATSLVPSEYTTSVFKSWIELSALTGKLISADDMALMDVLALDAGSIAECFLLVETKLKGKVKDQFSKILVEKLLHINLNPEAMTAFFDVLKNDIESVRLLSADSLEIMLKYFTAVSGKSPTILFPALLENIARVLAAFKSNSSSKTSDEPIKEKLVDFFEEKLIEYLSNFEGGSKEAAISALLNTIAGLGSSQVDSEENQSMANFGGLLKVKGIALSSVFSKLLTNQVFDQDVALKIVFSIAKLVNPENAVKAVFIEAQEQEANNFVEWFKALIDVSVHFNQPITLEDLRASGFFPASLEEVMECKEYIEKKSKGTNKKNYLEQLYYYWLDLQSKGKNFHDQLALAIDFFGREDINSPTILDQITDLPVWKDDRVVSLSSVIEYFRDIFNSQSLLGTFSSLAEGKKSECIDQLAQQLLKKLPEGRGGATLQKIVPLYSGIIVSHIVDNVSAFQKKLKNRVEWCNSEVDEHEGLVAAVLSNLEEVFDHTELEKKIDDNIISLSNVAKKTYGQVERDFFENIREKNIPYQAEKVDHILKLIKQFVTLPTGSPIEPYQIAGYVANLVSLPNVVVNFLYDLSGQKNAGIRQAIFSCFVYLHPEKTVDLLKALEDKCNEGLLEIDFLILKDEIINSFCTENSPARQIQLYQDLKSSGIEWSDQLDFKSLQAIDEPRDTIQRSEVSAPAVSFNYFAELAQALSEHKVAFTRRSSFFEARTTPAGVEKIKLICEQGDISDMEKMVQIRGIVETKKRTSSQRIYRELWKYFDDNAGDHYNSSPGDQFALKKLTENLKTFRSSASVEVTNTISPTIS